MPSFTTHRKSHFHSSATRKNKNFYDILGVPKSASKEDIKSKYRQLAKKHHPDMNKNDKNAANKFREITEAYEVLEDDKKRSQYDQFGVVDDRMGGGGGGGDPFGGAGGNPFAGFSNFGGFQGGGFRYTTTTGGFGGQDIFNMFNEAMERENAQLGRDVKTRLQLSFLEAVNGCIKDIRYEYNTKNGTKKTKVVNVNIPPGVLSGMTIKMAGEGAEAKTGNRVGDLFISLDIEEDSYFKREEYDIFTEVPISVSQVCLSLLFSYNRF